MTPREVAVHNSADARREQRDEHCGYYSLDLDQRYVADYHFDYLPVALHVAQVRLRAEPRGQAHVQVSFQAEKGRYKDEEL